MDGVTPKPPGLGCPSQHTMNGLVPLPPPRFRIIIITPYSSSHLPLFKIPLAPFYVIPAPLIRHPRESGDPWRPNNFLDSHFRGNDGFCVDLPLPIFVIPAPYIRHPRESGDP